MRELYTPELMVLVRELGKFEGFFIDKFYESARDNFRIKLSKSGMKSNIVCMLPCAINETVYIEEAEQASNFAIAVRKRITGFMIEKIEQMGKDRIIVIRLKKGAERVNLILEMFGQGNMVITDSAMQITLAYKIHAFKDREIRPKVAYAMPHSNAVDITDSAAVLNCIVDAIARTSDDKGALIGRTLSRGLGIGTLYTDNALARLGINPKSRLSEMKETRLPPIAESLSNEIRTCIDAPSFTVYKNAGIPIDFALTKIAKYFGNEEQKFGTFQEALDEFYHNAQQKHEEKLPEIVELEKSVEKQKEILQSIDAEISSNKRLGEEIFRNITEINKIINFARARKRATKDELQELSQSIKILDVNLKDKTVTIETSEGQ